MKILRLTSPFLAAAILLSASPAAAGWAPKDSCAPCHPEIWNGWLTSGHPVMLRTPEEARASGIPLPEGYAAADLSWVVGGRRNKALFLDRDGYLVTRTGRNRSINGRNQFDLRTGRWSDRDAGATVSYDCAPCHVTGWLAEGKQSSMAGVTGTWYLPGVTCERCHKPGGEHVASGGDKGKIVVERSLELCGKCHVRGEKNKLAAAGGFILNRQQLNEQQARKMHRLVCTTCHDPHQPASAGIRKPCAECHPDAAAAYAGSAMARAGVPCRDCHMPMLALSAEPAGPFQGDTRVHLYLVTTDPAARQFSEDGKWSNPWITVDYACLPCHGGRDRGWALAAARGVHARGKQGGTP